MIIDNVVMWETRLSVVDWVCSKTQILLETLKTLNYSWGGILCIFGSRTFLPKSWMRKKQTAVSHCSTESDIISLDTGLRMDGIPALDLWDEGIEVLHSSKNTHPHIKHRETSYVKKSGAQIPTPSLKEDVIEMMMNCQMLIKLSQTQVLLDAKLSSIFSRIMKL